MGDPGAACGLDRVAGLLVDLLRQGQRQFVEQLQGTGGVPGLQCRLFHAGRLHAFADGGDRLGDEGADDPGGEESAGVVDDDRSLPDLLHEVEGAGEDLVGGVLTADDLDQRHLVGRREEVDADEVLVAGDALGQVGDRQGRGVRTEHRIGFDDVLDLLEHLLLEIDGFEDRLDDEVDTGEILGRGARGDPVEDSLRLRLGGLALGQGRFLTLGSVGLALLRVGELDVLEHDLDARLRSAVGDRRPHHSGTDHAELLHLARCDTVRARAAGVDVAEVEEERLDHVLRHRSMGDVDEVAGLDRQRGVDVDQCAFDRSGDHGSRSRHRRTLALLAQQGRQRGKHRADLRRRRRAARDLEALDVPRLHSLGVGLDPGLGLGLEFSRRSELVDEAERLGIGGLELRRRQDGLLQSGLDAEHAHRPGDSAPSWQQAE